MNQQTLITLNKNLSTLKKNANSSGIAAGSLNGEENNCVSAISPLAYLADLLDYAIQHIKKEGVALTIADLENYFHQPFGQIPLNCEAVEEEVSQIRICVEVLRQLNKGETPSEDFQAKEIAYLEQTYSMCLLKLNTSISDLKGIAEASPEVRANLAGRIGVAETHLNELWKEGGELSENWIEKIFGIKNTNQVTFSPIVSSLSMWKKEYLASIAERMFSEEEEAEKTEWIAGKYKIVEELHANLVKEVEEYTLPILRSAFLPTNEIARQYSNELLINCEYDVCFRTTRVSQAISTLQQLITSLRNGFLRDTHPALVFSSSDFREEWKWLGSYEKWRSAMKIFLYPENILDPALKTATSPKFTELIGKIRRERRLSRTKADQYIAEYQAYFQDICKSRIVANCQAPVKYAGGAFQEILFMSFISNSNKVYYSSYFTSIEENTEPDDPTFWEKLPGLEENIKSIQILKAIPYRNSKNERAIYFFFRGYDRWGEKSLKYMLFNLELLKWDEEVKEIALPINSYSTIHIEQRNGEETPPRIIIAESGLDEHLFFVELNAIGDDVNEEGWVKIKKENINNLYNVIGFGDSTWLFYDLFHFPNSGSYGFYVGRIETVDGVKKVVHKRDLLFHPGNTIILTHSSIALLFKPGKNEAFPIELNNTVKWHTSFKLLEDDVTFTSSSINALEKEKLTIIVSHQSNKRLELVSFKKNSNSFIKDRAYFIQPFGVDYFDLVATKNVIDAANRRLEIKRIFESNADMTGNIRSYLWEAYFFLPMLIGSYLQRNRLFTDAKDYFRLIYDYSLPVEERKIFYGLSQEETLAVDFERGNKWLLDPLNPHSIAHTRKNAYTEYTIMTIARCFLREADEAFTHDSIGSLAKARILYTSALELLDNISNEEEVIGGSLTRANSKQARTLSSVIGNKNLLTESPLEAANDASMEDSKIGSFALVGSMLLHINTFEFSIPVNPVWQFLKLHAEINLFKINTCRNIAGDERLSSSLVIKSPRIETIASFSNNGVSLSSLPAYRSTLFRFSILIERAKQIANLAQQIESSFLSTLEKLDAERLNLLNVQNDLQLSRAGIRLQDLRLKEANDGVQLADLQIEKTEYIRSFYGKRLTEENRWEDEIGRLHLQNEVVSGIKIVQDSIRAAFTFGLGGDPWASASGYIQAQIGHAQWRSSYERRYEEWGFQRMVALADIKIGEQQKKIAMDQVKVVNQERNIASLRADQAEAIAEFLTNKFTNAELYDWMSEVLEGVYSFFLQQATATAQLAAQQLAFERQEPVPSIISADYWEAPRDNFSSPSATDMAVDRRGLTGSARLLQDIYQLDQFALQTDRRKLQLTKTISLARLSPIEFQQFRETGSLPFYTPMELFDRDFPGHYLRLIKRIRVSVIALAPPIDGIKATLWSNGISRTVQSINNVFTTTEIKRMPESIALTGALNASGIFDFDTDQSKLLPFESMGVDNAWEFQLPKASNLSLDYNAIADVLITIDYTALYSDLYKQQVIEQLDKTFMADRVYSFRNDFPDQWYDLHHPELVEEANQLTVHFDLLRADFPPNVMDLKVKHITLYLPQDDYPNLAISLNREGKSYPYQNKMTPNGIASSRQTDNFPGRWDNMLGVSPEGQWTLGFPDNTTVRQWFKADRFKDILLVITYEGDFA